MRGTSIIAKISMSLSLLAASVARANILVSDFSCKRGANEGSSVLVCPVCDMPSFAPCLHYEVINLCLLFLS